MTSVGRRLSSIEASLTPKQAVLRWISEAHGHGSLRAYLDSLKGAPDGAFPLFRLGDQMEASVRSALRGTGKPESDIWQAVRLAVRDAGFLYYLTSNLNWRALEHRRANWLHLALVAHMLSTALERETPQDLRAGMEQAREAAHTVYVQQGVVQMLAEPYFDGLSPLFPDVAEDVAEQVREIERVIGIFNAVLGALQPARRRSKRRSAPGAVSGTPGSGARATGRGAGDPGGAGIVRGPGEGRGAQAHRGAGARVRAGGAACVVGRAVAEPQFVGIDEGHQRRFTDVGTAWTAQGGSAVMETTCDTG